MVDMGNFLSRAAVFSLLRSVLLSRTITGAALLLSGFSSFIYNVPTALALA